MDRKDHFGLLVFRMHARNRDFFSLRKKKKNKQTNKKLTKTTRKMRERERNE